jgi:TPR repeat protein
MMYDDGTGVPQDYKEAVKWYRLSAEQGDAKAQYNLGGMYSFGEGVPQDYVSAHMWWNLSGSNGHKDAVKERNTLEKKMSPQQIEEAQSLARNWKPKK